MSELTITQIIKTIIAVFVIVVVVLGVYMAFKNYIFPMFGLEEEPDNYKPNYSQDEVQEIVQKGSVVAELTENGPHPTSGRMYFNIGGQTNVYISEEAMEGIFKKIKLDKSGYIVRFWRNSDSEIGKVYYENNYGEIKIYDSALSDVRGDEPELYLKLSKIDKGLRIGNKVYKR